MEDEYDLKGHEGHIRPVLSDTNLMKKIFFLK